jgi:RNA polymerase sigma-70 factor (ECF subfamily)
VTPEGTSADDEAGELAEIYRRFAPLVHARARRILGDEADDAVQEVFMRLLERRPEVERLAPWIYVTSTNICIERLRHRARRNKDWERAVAREIESGAVRSADELLSDRELCRRLLARVDERTQQVVLLVLFDEMSQGEAAEVLGLSRKTVGERLERFRERAAKMVKRWTT